VTAGGPVFVPNRRDVAHESFEDEVILIHFPSGKYFRLDAPGRVAWAALQSGATAAHVAAALGHAYDVGDAEALGEATRFLATLSEHGLVVPDGPSAAAPRNGVPAPAGRPPFQPPRLEVFTDLEQLFLVDPIHDVDATGWPNEKP
jgi:hypothetical protein